MVEERGEQGFGGIAVTVANKLYKRYGQQGGGYVDLEDFVSEARLALLEKVLPRLDPTRSGPEQRAYVAKSIGFHLQSWIAKQQHHTLQPLPPDDIPQRPAPDPDTLDLDALDLSADDKTACIMLMAGMRPHAVVSAMHWTWPLWTAAKKRIGQALRAKKSRGQSFR
jgi:hypothetical protein